MNHRFLLRLMDTSGISEHDFYKIMIDDNSKGVMTDETIFAVARYMNSVKGINVFLSRKVGTMEVRPKWGNNNVEFHIVNPDNTTLARLYLELNEPFLFTVKFPVIEQTIKINLDLLDYDGKDTTMDLRMRVLNEVLTRYYSRTLYAIYTELHRRV